MRCGLVPERQFDPAVVDALTATLAPPAPAV